MEQLKRIKAKRFIYSDVMTEFHIKDYAELKILIDELINQNKIAPIKKSGMTAFVPSIYYGYRKVEEKTDHTQYEKLIKMLHADLNITGYLNNPKKYVENKKAIEQLSNYLWHKKELLQCSMSVKERSYDIWKNEKF